jgi:hypothetical protein
MWHTGVAKTAPRLGLVKIKISRDSLFSHEINVHGAHSKSFLIQLPDKTSFCSASWKFTADLFRGKCCASGQCTATSFVNEIIYRAGLFCSGNDYIPGMRTIFSIKVLSQMLLIRFGPGSMCNCVASIFPEPARTWGPYIGK